MLASCCKLDSKLFEEIEWIFSPGFNSLRSKESQSKVRGCRLELAHTINQHWNWQRSIFFAEPNKDHYLLNMFDFALMNQDENEWCFGSASLTRAKYSGLVSNALLFLFNSKDPKLNSALERGRLKSNDLVRKTVPQKDRLLGSKQLLALEVE
jgi:hypothetical protein